ncbi:MAG: hypothetical protein JW873_02255 [Candidatus Saganbacteria bacterium]|nr:hypothetical protein [Candidatus Saganbacteria bacterium]
MLDSVRPPTANSSLPYRLPAVRKSTDKSMIISCYGWYGPESKVTGIPRNAPCGQLLEVPDESIIISETPHIIRSVRVTTCLAIALVDCARLVGAVVHTYYPEQFAEPLQFALAAINGRPENLRIGLSGMANHFDMDTPKRLAGITAGIGTFGRVVYNELGHKQNILINFEHRMIGSPPDDHCGPVTQLGMF